MSERKMQTVYIVDDDAAVRDSIAELVESVGMRAEPYGSGQAFLDAYAPQHPCCLVLDVRMPDISGMVLQQRLQAGGCTLPVIVLTGHGDVPMAVEAMKAGAVDFLQKPYREQALLDSINAALAIDSQCSGLRETKDQLEQRVSTLTAREREVFDYLLAGKTSKEIAMALEISPRTAEVHRRNVLRKCEVDSSKALLSLLAPPLETAVHNKP
jgi:FixJ family two-component response regulator